MARRIKLVVCYDGSEYHGWQVQPGLKTIQGTMEQAMAEIEGAAVAVTASGRTDAGVHALAQVAAVTIENPIPAANLKKALNRLLPRDIRVLAAEEAPIGFHPRFQAAAKTYEYRIWRGEICSPFDRRYVHHYPFPFDDAAFAGAAAVFEGEHDFSAFAATDEKDEPGASKVRTVFSAAASRDGDLLRFRVRGSGFLKHMVRNMTGGLIEVGRGNLTRESLAGLLEPGVARKLGHAAPARGLFLLSVEYP